MIQKLKFKMADATMHIFGELMNTNPLRKSRGERKFVGRRVGAEDDLRYFEMREGWIVNNVVDICSIAEYLMKNGAVGLDREVA